MAHRRSWPHRAYWGENVIAWGKDGTPERLRIGDLPAAASGSGWRSTAKKLGLKPGTVIDGWAFTQHDGTVYWDKAGIETWTPAGGPALRLARRPGSGPSTADGGAGLPDGPQGDRQARPREADRGPEEAAAATTSSSTPTSKTRAGRSTRCTRSSPQAEQERKQIDEQIPTTLVFREKAGEPKPAFMLKRGEYDQRRDKVGRATPAFLPPLPPDAPRQPPGPGPVAGRARTIR